MNEIKKELTVFTAHGGYDWDDTLGIEIGLHGSSGWTTRSFTLEEVDQIITILKEQTERAVKSQKARKKILKKQKKAQSVRDLL